MPTITATPVADGGYTRIVIDWSDTPEVDRAQVQRYPASYDPNSFVAPRVRSALPVSLTDPNLPYTRLSHGKASFFDYEAPLGAQVTYVTSAPNSLTQVTSAPVTLQAVPGVGWLKDPLRPANNLRLATDERSLNFVCDGGRAVFFVGMSGRRYKNDSTHFDIPGSAVGDVAYSTRKAYQATLRLATQATEDQLAMDALLAPGSPLLLQLPAIYDEPDQYLDIAEVQADRVSVDHQRSWRAYTLPYNLTTAPDSPSQGPAGTRWRDLCGGVGQYPTWTALKAAGLSYRDVIDTSSGRYSFAPPSTSRSTTPRTVPPP